MAEIRGVFEYPDGLTPRNSKEGGLSQLLSDEEGNLVGHGHFIPDEGRDEWDYEPEKDSTDSDEVSDAEALAFLIGVTLLVVYGAVKAAPHVSRWWHEAVVPRLQQLWVRRPGARRAVVDARDDQISPIEIANVSPATPGDFSKAIELAVDDTRSTMSPEEANQRLVAMLAAAAFLAEQVRLLSNARLTDEFPELQEAMEKLTTQQVTDSINHMLESNASLIDDATSTEFMRTFSGGRVVDGQYVQIRNEQVRQALRLTDGGAEPTNVIA